VVVDGSPVTGIPQGLGYMFQNDAVLPWRSVLDNVAAGPRYRGVPKAEARDRAREWVQKVGLAGFEGYHPHQLSGGMRKRVALAQTLINEPSILLMDEPFGALDVQTREHMQDLLLDLWSGTGAAVVFVTHDLTEAIALADQVVVMTAGPATVKAAVPVTLERPRRVEEIRLTPEFTDLYRSIWESLRVEVELTRARGARAA
jgi:NitT/TauT family transport system ATP-binding protein